MRLSWIRSRAALLAREEGGFTMIAVVASVALVSILVGVSIAATNSDQGLIQRDIESEARLRSRTGRDRRLHLPPQQRQRLLDAVHRRTHAERGEPAGRHQPLQTGRSDRCPTGPQYALELIPATGQSACNSNNPTVVDARVDRAEHRHLPDPLHRLFGYAGAAGTEKQSIVATYKQATFLDYVYFTQLETSDPVTYGYANPSSALTGAYSQCTKFRRDGRESSPIPGTNGRDFCDQIVFVNGDHIDGPLHTNDDLCICPGTIRSSDAAPLI